MAIGDRLDLEFHLKRRVSPLWNLLEPGFRERRLRRARAWCDRHAAQRAAHFQDIRGFCIFSGVPRSGHSTVATLLNAHENMLVSHNLDALDYFRHGFSRRDVFALIEQREEQFAAINRTAGGYSYEVPGMYQGNHGALRIIGDKRAGSTSEHLASSPDLLNRVAMQFGIPVYVVMHLRNPWDNINSIHARADIRRGRTLEQLVDWYFALLRAGMRAMEHAGERVHYILTRHEDLLRDPGTTVRKVLDAMALHCRDDYAAACRKFVDPGAAQPGKDVPWTGELIERVARQAVAYPMLDGYTIPDGSER